MRFFAATTLILSTIAPAMVFDIDINGDGTLEHVVTSSNGKAEITNSNGLNIIETRECFAWPFQNFADVNGDGYLDFIGISGTYADVVLGTSYGTFSPGYKFNNAIYFSWPNKYFADVTGDGRTDFISIQNNFCYVVPGTSAGTFDYGNRKFHNELYFNWSKKMFGDVNGDGKADYIATNGQDQYTVLGSVNGFDNQSRKYDRQIYFSWKIQFVRDVNGDGLSDFIAWNQNSSSSDAGGIYIVPGQSNGQFSYQRRIYFVDDIFRTIDAAEIIPFFNGTRTQYYIAGYYYYKVGEQKVETTPRGDGTMNYVWKDIVNRDYVAYYFDNSFYFTNQCQRHKDGAWSNIGYVADYYSR